MTMPFQRLPEILLWLALLLSTSTHGANHEVVSAALDQELDHAKTDISTNQIGRKFSTRKSRNPQIKGILSRALTSHVCSLIEHAQDFLAKSIARLKRKDLESIENSLQDFKQQLSVRNDYFIVASYDVLEQKRGERRISETQLMKYQARIRKIVVNAKKGIEDAVSTAFYQLVWPIQYIRLQPLHNRLLEQGLIGNDHYYLKKSPHIFPLNKLGICSICFAQATPSNPLITLKKCGNHKPVYCRGCLKDHIAESAKEMPIWDIECPHRQCDKRVLSGEVLDLFDFPEVSQMMKGSLARLQRESKEFFICPNEACVNGFGVRARGEQHFDCLFCGKIYCFDCAMENPIGEDCSLHQDPSLQFLGGAKVIQPCPACGHGIVRTRGCASVKCRCGNKIIYEGNFHDNGHQWDRIEQLANAANPQ